MTDAGEVRLLVASGNPKKLAELQRIFRAIDGLSIVGPEEVGPLPEVVEDGETFEHNARKKAREIAADKGMMTIADDSGLEVDALDGAPGVYSARYAGGGGDEANNEKLLRALAGVPDEARTARFRCVLAIADPTGALGQREHVASGAVEGRIGHAPRGAGGFGYDPLFFPEGRDVTMAELAPADKDAISHRARAAEAILPFLRQYCGNRR